MKQSLSPVVVVLNEQDSLPIDTQRWQCLASSSLRSSGVNQGELNLIFVDEAAMTKLNNEHLGNDYATDVLSFPIDGIADDKLAESVVGDVPLIGDVVVCPSRAAAQAFDHKGQRGHNGSLEDELALLIVHGILHVLGHDHYDKSTTECMQSWEQALLRSHHRQ